MENIVLNEQLDHNKYNKVIKELHFENYFSNEQLKEDITENGHSLSEGQIRLISLARALYREPKVLITDEIFANLDHEAISIIESLIKKFKKDHILVMIEHPDKLDHLATEIITLGDSIK